MADIASTEATVDKVLKDLAAGRRLDPTQQQLYAEYVERNRIAGRSDTARWSINAVFAAGWDERTSALAALLPANARSVADIGCGTMALRALLPPHMRYIPVDIAPRGDDTILIDLNAPDRPALPTADVAFFSGALEYVNDLPAFIRGLIKTHRYVVCSYAATNNAPGNVGSRRSGGWVNDYRTSEFISLFEDAGYLPTEMRDFSPHRLFVFFRRAVKA